MCMDYQRSVSRMFDMDSKELIPNNRPEHGAILVAEIIKHAGDYVHIFCRNMEKELYGTECVVNAVKEAKNLQNVCIDFVITEDKPEDSPLVSGQGELFKVYKIGNNVFDCPFFAVADGKSYRLENRNAQGADGCANDIRTAGLLENIFRCLRSMADKNTRV